MNMGNNVCAIITAYNAGDGIAKTIEAVLLQVGKIWVIDDHSTTENFSNLEKIAKSFKNVSLIRNTEIL
jgi:glycosyltransferase involved in cell wall biosynthesis